jgi:hypothetical protein
VAYAVNISLYLIAAWRRGHALPWRSGIGGPLIAMLVAALVATNPSVPGTAGVKLVVVWFVVIVATRGLRPADVGQLLDLLRRRR